MVEMQWCVYLMLSLGTSLLQRWLLLLLLLFNLLLLLWLWT